MIKWKKALESLPEDGEEVIVKKGEKFYVATFSRSDSQFKIKGFNEKIPATEVDCWASFDRPR